MERPLPKDYSVLPPRQLNDVLRGFYKGLPRPNPSYIVSEDVRRSDIVMSILNDINRRGKSDYHKTYMANLHALLQQSPSTATFRDYVLDVFHSASVHTVLKTNRDSSDPHDNQVASLLDLDEPESGGIFDSERVKEMEREVYRELFENHMAYLKGGIGASVRHSLQAKYDMDGDYSMKLGVWGQQFLDLYGEEP